MEINTKIGELSLKLLSLTNILKDYCLYHSDNCVNCANLLELSEVLVDTCEDLFKYQ